MDIFKFTENDPADFVGAEPVAGYDEVSWVERYRKPGEFAIKAKLSSGLRDQLAIGSYIGHTKTYEIMIVEDHTIQEVDGEDPVIEITGRSLEVILEDRAVGSAVAWSDQDRREIAEIELPAAAFPTQVVTFVNNHINGTYVTEDELTGIDCSTYLSTGPSERRIVKPGSLHKRMIELLALEDYGVRTIRPHNWTSPFTGVWPQATILIHNGNDKTSDVIFSGDVGDIRSGEYFWTRRDEKNVALVMGSALQITVEPSPVPTGEDRRVLLVDGSDIDRDYESGVTPQVDIDAMYDAMIERGNQELSAHNNIIMQSVDISGASDYEYRVDYDIGDLVRVLGSFGQTASMRVVEFAEFEDDSGISRIPTLAHIP